MFNSLQSKRIGRRPFFVASWTTPTATRSKRYLRRALTIQAPKTAAGG
jgi:hypothetical protein